jgi:hypothetical protein
VAAARRGRVATRGEPALIAALPASLILAHGRSLAGVRLGESSAQVRAHLGTDYGVCRGCATTTWYFTYRRFDDKGLAVELTEGRVSAVYTLWQPPAADVSHKITIGAPQERVGPAITVSCSGYTALVKGTAVYLVVDGKVWGLGLFRRGSSPCR